MKKLLKVIGILLAITAVSAVILFFVNDEPLPEGEKGKAAEELAQNMVDAMNKDFFDAAEVIEWSFRNEHFYKWKKQEGIVHVTWQGKEVLLNTNNNSKSTVLKNPKNESENELITKAFHLFNNDSFWLVAPYKIFDSGTERRIVNYEGKDALLVTYTSGGSTPGDSYLWILDEDFKPVSYKMWTSILPLGGIAASWSDWKKTEAGLLLPTKHRLSLFDLEIDMGEVKAYNENANKLANRILNALHHEEYKKTKFIEWSFGGRRHFKWNKEAHVVDVSWDDFKVNLYPGNIEKSTVYFKGEKEEMADEKIIKRAWDIFNNDSFWLVGPHKLFDDGVIRNITSFEGKDALKVTYTRGGTTPGDSYIWVIDDEAVPTQFLMTVPSMKMDKVPATWEGWITTESGTKLPTNHTFGSGRSLSMGEVKAYN